jgi:hypothetical protein
MHESNVPSTHLLIEVHHITVITAKAVAAEKLACIWTRGGKTQ